MPYDSYTEVARLFLDKTEAEAKQNAQDLMMRGFAVRDSRLRDAPPDQRLVGRPPRLKQDGSCNGPTRR